MDFIGAQPTVDLTYSDVFLVPRHSEVGSRLNVQLDPRDGTPATIPLVAANMNAVSGPRLAAVLARRGGLAVLPQDLPLAEMEAAVSWVKRQSPIVDTPVVLPPEATAAEALRLIPRGEGQCVAVIADAQWHDPALPGERSRAGALTGILGAERLETVPSDARLDDLVRGQVPSIGLGELGDARGAFERVLTLLGGESALGAGTRDAAAVAVLDGDELVGVLTPRSALRRSVYAPALDRSGRLGVGAAIGINGEAVAKARVLAAAGVDALVIDTAHGHQAGMLRTIREIAALDLGLPIVAGNVVTADGVRDLVEAGASIIKVGVGPGAMCTTRMMTAVGRPQFSAVLETAHAARELGAHVWADGGVRYPRDVALALAAGASSVMIGSWFAGTAESPGELVADEAGRQYKESWGMASTKAVKGRFGSLDAFERARKELFAEGISSSKIYLDPLRPSVEDLVDMITSGVRSSFTYAGAATLEDFHVRARVGLQSAAGYEEGKALPVSW